ncbi:MAG: glycosyltransferase family 2 protein [Tagaea sp.]
MLSPPPTAIVKTCDRPHSLVRCLESLARYARGLGGVVVLDDGLAPSDVAEIRKLHPRVDFRRSPYADAKGAIRRGEATGRIAAMDPMAFWIDGVASLAGPYALILEEDTWLARPLDFAALLSATPGAVSIRLYPYGDDTIVDPSEIYDRKALADGETVVFFAPRIVRRDIDLAKISAAGPGLFRRDFWLAGHAKVKHWADELTNIQEAGKFCAAEQADGRLAIFAKLARGIVRHETLSTSRIDSGGVGFVVDNARFNSALARAWSAGRFDSLARFPGEPDAETVAAALATELGAQDAAAWRAWRAAFLAHYTNANVNLSA